MDHSAARRQLLRGSLAAPVVLTVASPSALAATSFQACITRGTQPDPSVTFVASSTADTWLRKQVAVWSGKLKTTNVAGNYYYSDVDTLYYPISGCGTGLPASDFTGNRLTDTGTTAWGLVFFDLEGRTVGFGCQPGGGYAITGSCWASFTPTA